MVLLSLLELTQHWQS